MKPQIAWRVAAWSTLEPQLAAKISYAGIPQEKLRAGVFRTSWRRSSLPASLVDRHQQPPWARRHALTVCIEPEWRGHWRRGHRTRLW
jgi:hypothetical protein